MAPLVAGLLLTGCGTATDPAGQTPTQAAPSTTGSPTAAEQTFQETTAPEPRTEEVTQEATEETTTEATTDETTEDSTEGSTEESTSGEDAAEDGGTEEGTTDASGTGAAEPTAEPENPDGRITATVDSLEGIPLTAPAEELVAAVEAELGEPELSTEAATDCNGTMDGHVWMWEGLALTDLGDEITWQVDGRLAGADLPEGLAIGTSEVELRAAHDVVEESMTGGGWPILVLQEGYSVTLDPSTRDVSDVSSRHTPTC